MPAWLEGRYLGVKIVTVFPDNGRRSLPSVYGTYLLMSGASGVPLATFDGSMLTLRRTACASALAARHLARDDASRLLMIGTGALAPHLVNAHAAIRPIRYVRIWGRSRDKAAELAAKLARPGLAVAATDDLEAAVREADVISCATLSKTPLVRGAWLKPGQHVDLVGSYAKDMREADDDVIRRASVHIDTDAAAAESGDLAQPLASGVLTRDAICGTLARLCRGEAPGRRSRDEITMFKSAGTAIEDLAAAVHLYESTR
jgi:ornithine cyclodeaminase